jgi:flavodoxin
MKNSSVVSAYFTHSGNTRVIAQLIHRLAGGDLFEILPAAAYPSDYDTVVEQAKKERDSGYIPPLKTKIADMDPYKTVFIGYPNWWNTIPRPVVSFLSEYDFSGKTIAPFCTHGGGGIGRSVADIRALCPKANVTDGIAIPGSSVNHAEKTVAGWLRELGIPGR